MGDIFGGAPEPEPPPPPPPPKPIPTNEGVDPKGKNRAASMTDLIRRRGRAGAILTDDNETLG